MTGQRPVKIGLVGGSIAWGQAADRGKDDFFTLFAKWLTTAFPKANVTTRNGAIPGTPSAYMVSLATQLIKCYSVITGHERMRLYMSTAYS